MLPNDFQNKNLHGGPILNSLWNFYFSTPSEILLHPAVPTLVAWRKIFTAPRNKGWSDVLFRSSHRRCSVRKGFLRKFAKFTGKNLCQSLFFIKETLAQVFSCEFCELSKFLTEHLRWLV